MTSPDLRTRAEEHLRALAGATAVLRDDQWSAIEALVVDHRRVVVVQRTGFGKSAVYWVATRLRRDAGAGPTLVISPLLALMRDQVRAASAMGLRAATINSANFEEWETIEAQILDGSVDVVLVSPERLNSLGFRSRILGPLSERLGMLVVDEAHTISDWGHDFRPDYRRLRDVLASLPAGTPVLATTATANARVTRDVAAQLGDDTLTLRGPLGREGLALGVFDLPSSAHRWAWVASALERLDGSGIVYTLTVAETERLRDFLVSRGFAVEAYSGRTDPADRERIESGLRSNALKAVVATSSLGMGFDKPDLAFVVHVGSPSSPIAYYQQVGRAGRALERATAVLLPGEADRSIWEYFDSSSLPPRPVVERVLDLVRSADHPLSLQELERSADLRRGRLELLLKVLDVEGALERTQDGYVPGSSEWSYDEERYAALRRERLREQQLMLDYQHPSRCLMRVLREELDDVPASDCGICMVCDPSLAPLGVTSDVPEDLVAAARQHLRGTDVPVFPRKMWPAGLPSRRGRITGRAEDGRALAQGEDPGWGELLAADLSAGAVSDELFDGVVGVLRRWRFPARPTWVAYLPGEDDALLSDLASRLAERGRLELVSPFTLDDSVPVPGEASPSVVAAGAALDRLGLSSVPEGPGIVLAARYGDGWAVTVAADLLLSGGSGPVMPLVLHTR